MRWTALAAFAITLCCATAEAQTWTGPDSERRPRMLGQADLDFALSEICFPFLLQNADIAAITDRRGVTAMRNPPDWASGDPTFWVGQPDLMVALDDNGSDSGRDCTIRVRDGDVERYREAFDARMAQWPNPLSPAARPLPANAYERRDTLCGPAEGVQDNVIVSQGGGRGLPAMMITITRGGPRYSRCNADETPPDQAAADLFSDAARACRAIIDGRDADEAAPAFELRAPILLRGSPFANPQTGLVEFFGADSHIRYGEVRGEDHIAFMVVAGDGAKCQATAIGNARFSERLREDLGAEDANWAPDESGGLRRPNGARLRQEYDRRPDGRAVIHVYVWREN